MIVFGIHFPYSCKIGRVSQHELENLAELCWRTCGHAYNDWFYQQDDYLFNYDTQSFCYSNVIFYFKHQEHCVMFKLAYNPE